MTSSIICRATSATCPSPSTLRSSTPACSIDIVEGSLAPQLPHQAAQPFLELTPNTRLHPKKRKVRPEDPPVEGNTDVDDTVTTKRDRALAQRRPALHTLGTLSVFPVEVLDL